MGRDTDSTSREPVMLRSHSIRYRRPGRRHRSGFTLIEVLVVVAIIALLVAVLLPSLARAREQSRAVVCLSHLKQQGIGFSGYSAANKTILPWAGTFKFSLMEGKYYLGFSGADKADWTLVNIGLLYPGYIGKEPKVFYCPNNKAVDITGANGIEQFLRCYRAPKRGQSGYQDSHAFPISPFSSYNYGAPLLPAHSPRDAGSKMYPDKAVRYGNVEAGSESAYGQYLDEPVDLAPSFLGPFPRESRGKHPVHALVTDGYFAGPETFTYEGKRFNREPYEGYHLQSYNVLFGDFHAKRIRDPQGQIHAAGLSPIGSVGYSVKAFKIYKVWDYFSRQP